MDFFAEGGSATSKKGGFLSEPQIASDYRITQTGKSQLVDNLRNLLIAASICCSNKENKIQGNQLRITVFKIHGTS